MTRLRPFAVFALTLCLVVLSSPAIAGSEPAPATPASYVLVDNDTGKVLSAAGDRENLPPASITKLLTALVAIQQLPEDKLVPVAAGATAMPAMRIGVQTGQMWNRDDLLRSLLMVSANDAAVALADASGGSLAGFSTMRYAAARELGLADNPTLNDPAGLDDTTFSNDGGDRISARDMAIVARAALANPLIKSIVATKQAFFTGPDGVRHELPNHNKMLSSYPGAIGMKTGYTQKAKNTFVGAAVRNGRTMLVVVMGADNPYNFAETLLDQGFATPVTTEPADADVLPLHVLGDLRPAAAPAPVAKVTSSDSHRLLAVVVTLSLLALLGLAAFFLRIRDAATSLAIVERDNLV